ncbi:MAG: hypothetical protein ABH881_00235 [bacterium]
MRRQNYADFLLGWVLKPSLTKNQHSFACNILFKGFIKKCDNNKINLQKDFTQRYQKATTVVITTEALHCNASTKNIMYCYSYLVAPE